MGSLILPSRKIIDFKVIDVVINKSYTFFYRLSESVQKIYIERILDIRLDGVYLTEKVWVRDASNKYILKHLGDDYITTVMLRLETLKEYINNLK